jgi:hypothetical protein
MDLQNILKASKDFYKSHQLDAWAKALPNSIKLNKEAELAIARAEVKHLVWNKCWSSRISKHK